MATITSGELVHRITLQVLPTTEVSDGHDGYVDPAWLPMLLRIPARVRPLQGRDLERARQIEPRTSHEVTTRYWRGYRDDLRGGRAQVVYHDDSFGDRTFEIVAPPIDVDERHEEIRMLCREAA